ncbi:probable protein arginine N-methyltransferase 1.2 [Melanaphis sacchari]|uniref:Protein arginine N-methyltransferase 1-A n=1 Tax=Melanaphis sacchari TaxID=742174 RepID=A0A2H8TY82_9HEMI|nr:probable protein arginine N-methyltransferase 1.2 [Melanaphis sacchari]XP_025196023.1 probable protein arginine N-methyltransferase 1.2 [Melanaphis sacchari]
MQKHNGNNANYYSRWRNVPKNQQQIRRHKTRDQNVEEADDSADVMNPTSNTKAYFDVVQPTELSVFSDQNLYDESKSSVSRNSPLNSNSISETVDAKNGKYFFADKTNWRDKNVGQHQSNYYSQSNKFNNKKYPNKYRKNRNNAPSKFQEFISTNNVNHNTFIENDQLGTKNDYSYEKPAIEPALNQNTLFNNTFLNTYQNSEYDSECDSDPGDLEKMKIMTAADFNDDRYARYGIHETEIKDYVRTITFKNCIEYCAKEYIKDKVVLVIRCGIGLLPLLCARDGQAKKVIALEQSSCIEYARRIITDNRYSTVITLIQSSVHDLKQLPHRLKKVDVIVGDFLGDCVISQGDQMEQVIEARDRFLVSNGLMIPMCVTLYGQLLEQRRIYGNCRIRKKTKKKAYKKLNKRFNINKSNKSETQSNDSDSSSDSTLCSWWSNVYGFDMRSYSEITVDCSSESVDCPKSFKDEWRIMEEPIVTFFDPSKVVSNACLIKKFDMYKCTINEVRYVHSKDLSLKCSTPYTSANGGDYAHMLELFMVVDFPNGQTIVDDKDDLQIGFSTSSYSPFTRFRQTGLLLRDQLLVEQGDKFKINEFYMWRGPQQKQKLVGENIITKSTRNRYGPEENLKLRLNYTFINQHIKAINRHCAYTLVKQLF